MAQYKRIVIKIGSALLVMNEDSAVRTSWLAEITENIAKLRQSGHEIVIVSSGAMALGRRMINIRKTPKETTQLKQAVAAIGQIQLMKHFQEYFAKHDCMTAQILLTPQDTEERVRHLNARNTINQLLKLGVIPIINENDSVATEEIRYGDNDRLSARVASMISADLLILLSDIDGLYTKNPKIHTDAELIKNIRQIDKTILSFAGGNIDERSTGGMITKLHAAQIAMNSGVNMIIANGNLPSPLLSIWNRPHSVFHANSTPKLARKKWLAGLLNPDAIIVIDDGAITALKSGKSLLPAGCLQIIGNFESGSVLLVQDQQANRIAIGLASHDGLVIAPFLGKKSPLTPPELIHRDNLALYE